MRYVGLLRGINVGTAKRIAMADLTRVFVDQGFDNVRTLLQSGNVVFDAARAPDARAIEDAIHAATGVRAALMVIDEERFRAVVDANPLLDDVEDPSRALVDFLDGAVDVAAIVRPSDGELAPERIAFGDGAIYQWCPDGVSKTKLPPRFFAELGVTCTGRNLRTVDKLLGMLDE
jgi:uncharacterized protein (DUF1697 family)